MAFAGDESLEDASFAPGEVERLLFDERDMLGLWLGPSGGEGAKQWATMLTELRNRGLQDALIVCCDGLKGLPESIRDHLARGDRPDLCGAHGPKQPPLQLQAALVEDHGGDAGDLHRPTVEAAETHFAEFAGERQGRANSCRRALDASPKSLLFRLSRVGA
jgi:hypothetical protein